MLGFWLLALSPFLCNDHPTKGFLACLSVSAFVVLLVCNLFALQGRQAAKAEVAG